jgi:hypothetical protein
MEEKISIANLNIDRTKPKIEVIQIKNTNENYEKYANKTHTITVKIKIIEQNLKEIKLDAEHIDLSVGGNIVKPNSFSANKIQEDENIYELNFKEISGNGNLEVIIKEGAIIDTAGWENEQTNIDTQILIDNIAPKGTLSEEKIDGGKVNAKIELTEEIRNLEGWNFSSDRVNISKEFTNNVSYELPIVDYAGNENIVEINITEATYIKITYGSHNSVVGWTFGYGNYDIAGYNAIKINPLYKTEAIAFNVSGNVDSDFVQANAYIYTYWGNNSEGKCNNYGITYKYGYNPGNNEYKSMKSGDLVEINGVNYFQLGGAGINLYNNCDINGNNPIPNEIALQYYYGISSIKLKLKDYSQFSIIYQIYQQEAGWIQPQSDGEECVYRYDKPISAFRLALVPKSEKVHVIDTWNKDIGKKGIE